MGSSGSQSGGVTNHTNGKVSVLNGLPLERLVLSNSSRNTTAARAARPVLK
jgi:hypothetical protein